jgi:hypothetical protein
VYEEGEMKERDYAPTRLVLSDIFEERLRQDKLREAGRFEHTLDMDSCPDLTRVTATTEELGEVCRALQKSAHDGTLNLRDELVQLGALTCAWIEFLDGKGK